MEYVCGPPGVGVGSGMEVGRGVGVGPAVGVGALVGVGPAVGVGVGTAHVTRAPFTPKVYTPSCLIP